MRDQSAWRFGTLELNPLGVDDVLVENRVERYLIRNRETPVVRADARLPRNGYPLVPGYESVGRVIEAGANVAARIGEWVFVPGANCYSDRAGFLAAPQGALSSRQRAPCPYRKGLAQKHLVRSHCDCTARNQRRHTARSHYWPWRPWTFAGSAHPRDRRARAHGLGNERTSPRRCPGYGVTTPENDTRRDYTSIYDASGDAGIFDDLISRLAKGGEITLAGFYSNRINFAFPPAFMKEARLRIAG